MFDFLKKDTDEVVAPVKGRLIRMEEVTDQVFASKMMGDGFAVVPIDDTIICAPMDGIVEMIPESKHAVGLKNKNGVELLIHVGLDTVNLQGEGLKTLVKVGEKVKKGTSIIQYDKVVMENYGIDMTTMVIFLNGYDKEINPDSYGDIVSRGQLLIR